MIQKLAILVGAFLGVAGAQEFISRFDDASVSTDAITVSAQAMTNLNATASVVPQDLAIQVSGTDRAIFLAVTALSDVSPTAVWNPSGSNQSFTRLDTIGGAHGMFCFSLINPAVGTSVIRVTWPGTVAGALQVGIGALVLNRVHQTIPMGTFTEDDTPTAGGGGNQITVQSFAGGLTVVCGFDGLSVGAPLAPFTQVLSVDTGEADFSIGTAPYQGSSPVTATWTGSGSVMMGVTFKGLL